jgi:predicted RND superfamily exporter protein|tara:strand:- start:6004 stop:8307 length:2304 start_codon:yes stop_codon:yes gene_type:complete
MIKVIADKVIKYRLVILLITVVITSVAAYFAITGVTLRASLNEMLPSNHKNVELYEQFSDKFGGVNTVLIMVENINGSVYEKAFLEKYKNISDAFYFHEANRKPLFEAVNLRKTRAVSGAQGQIQVMPLMWPKLPETDAEMDRFRLLIRGQFNGYLISLDEKSLMIAAEFKDNVDTNQLINFVGDMRSEYEDGSLKLSIVGRPILLGEVKQELPKMISIFALSVLAISIFLYLFFQTWVGVVIPMAVAFSVTILGFGVIGFTGFNMDPLLLLLPFFVFATVLSHSVQFVSRVFDELTEGKNMKDAVRIGLERLLFPSTAAVITSAAGFTVLILVAIPSIQSLALICTIWLLTLSPGIIAAAAFMSYFKVPNKFKTTLPFQTFLARLFGEKMSAKFFLPCFIIFLIGGFFISQNLKIGDAVGSPILWPDSRYNSDVGSINSNYDRIGTDVLQAYFSGEEEIMLNPDVYHQSEAFDRHIFERVLPATPASSLAPIIKNINMVLWEGDPSYQFIPDTSAEVGFNIYMFRSNGEPGDFAAYTNPEWNIGKLSIFTSEHSSETVDELIRHGEEFVNNYDFNKDEPIIQFAGGQIGLIKATNDEIRLKQNLLLIAIILIIILNLVWVYRSIKLGMIITFVLSTSHFMTMSVMALLDVGMNLNTLPLAALGLGRGVDYSIYMADRMRDEMKRGLDYSQATIRAFNTSGVAIIVTSLTMILPLLSWSFLSPIRFQAEMGLLLAIILAFNMLGALTVVPALIKLLKPKGFYFDRSK